MALQRYQADREAGTAGGEEGPGESLERARHANSDVTIKIDSGASLASTPTTDQNYKLSANRQRNINTKTEF